MAKSEPTIPNAQQTQGDSGVGIKSETALTPVAKDSCDKKPKGRNAKGLFLPGNKLASGSKGNPFLGSQQKFKAWFLESISKKDFDGIRKVLIQKSKEGDLRAIELFLHYTVGKPKEHIELDANIDQKVVTIDVVRAMQETLEERKRITIENDPNSNPEKL